MCGEVDDFSSATYALLAKINPIAEKFKWYQNGKLNSADEYLTKIKTVFGISTENGNVKCQFCELSGAMEKYQGGYSKFD